MSRAASRILQRGVLLLALAGLVGGARAQMFQTPPTQQLENSNYRGVAITGRPVGELPNPLTFRLSIEVEVVEVHLMPAWLPAIGPGDRIPFKLTIAARPFGGRSLPQEQLRQALERFGLVEPGGATWAPGRVHIFMGSPVPPGEPEAPSAQPPHYYIGTSLGPVDVPASQMSWIWQLAPEQLGDRTGLEVFSGATSLNRNRVGDSSSTEGVQGGPFGGDG